MLASCCERMFQDLHVLPDARSVCEVQLGLFVEFDPYGL